MFPPSRRLRRAYASPRVTTARGARRGRVVVKAVWKSGFRAGVSLVPQGGAPIVCLVVEKRDDATTMLLRDVDERLDTMKAYGVDKHSGKLCDVLHCTSCMGKAGRRGGKGRNPACGFKKAARRAARALAREGAG